jgi:hypothetical protein
VNAVSVVVFFCPRKDIFMALTPENEATIEQSMASLKVLLRTSLNKDEFISDHTFFLANMESDLGKLHVAGLPLDKPEFFRGCFDVLVMAIGERGGSSAAPSEKKVQYDGMEKLLGENRVELGVAGKYIADNSGDPAMVKRYKYIQKSSGVIDSAKDVIGLSGMVKLYPELALQIKPDGKTIDEAYCKGAVNNAVELLRIKGFVMVKGVPQNNSVDRQNRILTLCIQNQNLLKTFAKAAFCKNMEYYNTRYTSQFKKSTSDDDDVDVDSTVSEPAEIVEPATA